MLFTFYSCTEYSSSAKNVLNNKRFDLPKPCFYRVLTPEGYNTLREKTKSENKNDRTLLLCVAAHLLDWLTRGESPGDHLTYVEISPIAIKIRYQEPRFGWQINHPESVKDRTLVLRSDGHTQLTSSTLYRVCG